MESLSIFTGVCSTSSIAVDTKLNGTVAPWTWQGVSRTSLRSTLASKHMIQSKAPSALLNSKEYSKKKKQQEQQQQEKQGFQGESDSDEDLCPIECVREIDTLRELEHVIHDVAKSTGALVVVDFFRTACGSCRYIEKGFAKLCKGAGNGDASVIFLKHNVMDEYEEQSDIAEKFGIKVVPLFHFYKNGELVESFPTRDKKKILETIYKYLDVDQTIEEWSDVHGLK